MQHYRLINAEVQLLQSISEFPQRGGANGSVRFYPEIIHAANAGINEAAWLLLQRLASVVLTGFLARTSLLNDLCLHSVSGKV